MVNEGSGFYDSFWDFLAQVTGGRNNQVQRKVINLSTSEKYRLKRLIQKFQKAIGPELNKRYGGKKHYTIPQVKRIIEDFKIKPYNTPYVYAKYLNQEDYDFVTDEESIEEAYESLIEILHLLETSPELRGSKKLLNIRESGIY